MISLIIHLLYFIYSSLYLFDMEVDKEIIILCFQCANFIILISYFQFKIKMDVIACFLNRAIKLYLLPM